MTCRARSGASSADLQSSVLPEELVDKVLFSQFQNALCGLASTDSALTCPGEAESLAARLHSSRQRVSELERTLSSISMQQKQSEEVRVTSVYA